MLLLIVNTYQSNLCQPILHKIRGWCINNILYPRLLHIANFNKFNFNELCFTKELYFRHLPNLYSHFRVKKRKRNIKEQIHTLICITIRKIKPRLNLSKCRSSRETFPPLRQARHENNRITAEGTIAEKDYRLNDCPYRSLKLFIPSERF